MHVLVINSGSSSIKFSIFDAATDEPRSLYEGEITGIGGPQPHVKFRSHDGHDLAAGRGLPTGHGNVDVRVDAIGLVVSLVRQPGLPSIDAVGYRVVHPGARLDSHQRITDEVLKELEDAVVFAPLHDPAAIQVIRQSMTSFPNIGHYACFDTVFHSTMPEVAFTYPIPLHFRQQGVRRYGFHGLSCESIVFQLRRQSSIPFPRRMIIAHLGSGSSVTALIDGKSIDTSMGLTPTGGVVMGTRPGDLDPGLLLYLLRQVGDDGAAKLETMLNHKCGIVALSGMPNDMKMLREAVAEGNTQAQLAADIFTRSVKKNIGAFVALMGGIDALVFAGGIGENDARSRQEIASGLEIFGISLNSTSNQASGDAIRRLDASDCQATTLVVPAQEDRMIAIHVHHLAQSGDR